jgi:hypothetical protein
MTRTLLAFGDSHTAGAEIEKQYVYECFEKAYPAYIAKHYKMEYENYSHAGGSNDWSFKQFNDVIKKVILDKEDVFVLFNFTEASRTYINTPYVIESNKNHDENYYEELHYQARYLNKDFLQKNWEHPFEKTLIKYSPVYKHYILSHTNKTLDEKSLNQMFIVQTICEKYDIPFIFHNSINWYSGNWSLINKKNHFGHHSNVKTKYGSYDLSLMESLYSFWGVACNHQDWKHYERLDRWHGHYPESYHKFWAQTLINFIDEQKILEGYI